MWVKGNSPATFRPPGEKVPSAMAWQGMPRLIVVLKRKPCTGPRDELSGFGTSCPLLPRLRGQVARGLADSVVDSAHDRYLRVLQMNLHEPHVQFVMVGVTKRKKRCAKNVFDPNATHKVKS